MNLNSRRILYVAKNSSTFERAFGFSLNLTFKNSIALSNDRDKIFLIHNGKVIDEFFWNLAKRGIIYFKSFNG